jgi:Spy/CpxP family protein refolding chaperone
MTLRTTLFACLALLLCCFVCSFAASIIAQDASPAEADDPANSDDATHRRLPPYYNDLVTPGQRARIYKIQDDYESQIEELKKQLREVVAQRDAEVEAVLEPEQRELLTQVKEQSRLLREARAKAAAKLKERLPEDEASEVAGD